MEEKNYNFEELLGKPTSKISQFLDCDFQHKKMNKVFFDIILKKESNYYDSQFKLISFVMFENDRINLITIHFNTILNLKFYNLFVQNYGSPKNIFLNTGKKTVNSIDEEDDEHKTFKQILKQTLFEDTTGIFEDKPSGVIWEKENYIIRMMLFYEENVSSITFLKNV